MPTQRTQYIKLTAADQAVITTCYMGIAISNKDFQRACFRQCIQDTIYEASGYDSDFLEWLEDKEILYKVDSGDYQNANKQLVKLLMNELFVTVILL